MADSLGDRMKEYEGAPQTRLMRRTPVIIRLDGKAFHTFTRGMRRPWDEEFARCMWETAAYLCAEVQGCRLAYVQSDEISLLLTDWEKHTTQAWFNYEVQKVCSVSAGVASSCFSQVSAAAIRAGVLAASSSYPCFDSRCFNLPVNEVANYFIWRQQDATRNSVQSLGQHHIGRKQVRGMNQKRIQDALVLDHGVNWNDCEVWQKRGVCVVKETYTVKAADGAPFERSRWVPDMDIPIFTQDRDYIGRHIAQ